MRSTIRVFVLLGAVAPLLAMAAAAPVPESSTPAAAAPGALFTNTIIAKGKDVSITRGALDQEVIRLKGSLAAQGRSLSGDPAVVERQVLDGLIGKQLLLAKTSQADRAKAKAEFEASLQKYRTNNQFTVEQFNEKIKQQLLVLGMTRQQWEEQGIEQEALPLMLQRELKVEVTDAEARQFYNENPGKFEQPEMVRAAHILLMTINPVTRQELSEDQKAAKHKQIEDILKRARAGEDFAKLAKEYSEDPGSKDRGGEYTFPRGQMTPAFEAAAFSLNTNQISDVVTTPYGYHIIKLYEKIPAKKVDFEKVSQEIKDYLVQRQIQLKVPDYLKQLRKDADVKILDARLASVEVPAAPAMSQEPPAAE
jgi:peptidyl-prolyl cis-trans isomerase C